MSRWLELGICDMSICAPSQKPFCFSFHKWVNHLTCPKRLSYPRSPALRSRPVSRAAGQAPTDASSEQRTCSPTSGCRQLRALIQERQHSTVEVESVQNRALRVNLSKGVSSIFIRTKILRVLACFRMPLPFELSSWTSSASEMERLIQLVASLKNFAIAIDPNFRVPTSFQVVEPFDEW